MHRDDEPSLKGAFAELHCRQREQAPPFGAMRERATREANRRPATERRLAVRWVQCAAAAACVLTTALWWMNWRPTPPQVDGADTLHRLEQSLTGLEQQLEFYAALSSPEYPTDLLLTNDQTEPSL